VERDLGAMQMEALELRGSARSREAEAAALRERVAEQEQQVVGNSLKPDSSVVSLIMVWVSCMPSANSILQA